MPLRSEERKPDGAPAIVTSLKDFQKNFNVFSELSLTDLDWNNVVVAGSAVTTSLLPIPDEWAGNKKKMREWYHMHFAPASDIDLFLYGLDENQARKKIKQIERAVKDGLLVEATTVRSKHCITIVSQYPTRHVQIVLRLYPSISQILTGFDVDCSCVAYTGSQVYASPRAIAAFLTQCNTLDLSRRSPSYESRLSKYSHRGFEVHWPLLDRDRIDPTVFERSFSRVVGLARLLVLEKLPKIRDREKYMDQRRAERGRPALERGYRDQFRTRGNIKDQAEDEVAEWMVQEDEGEANYHTMTVPYGPKFGAKKIEKMLFAQDLLLNAEWNLQGGKREVYLHRHPCFFGAIDEVVQDCCGYCPKPTTDEEIEIAEVENKRYVSGELSFLVDNPGRQEIGSFNPVTDDEFTTMAYVGDTELLCQAIVDTDVEYVKEWCEQEGTDVNTRDYTGRTPLHLAVMCSSVRVVECLVEHGARLIARLVDGRTALHLAAARGNTEIIKVLMNRSLANEEEEAAKVEARRAARRAERKELGSADGQLDEDADSDSERSEISLKSEERSENTDDDSMTMSSFVKVPSKVKDGDDALQIESKDDPDVYDIDTPAWDYGLTPLHFAILEAHLEALELLVCEYGAQVLLPVKPVTPGTSNSQGAILSLLLALHLEPDKAKETAELLLTLGATSRQADMKHMTLLHFVVAANKVDILDLLVRDDLSAKTILNNLGGNYRLESPLHTAVGYNFENIVQRLLDAGAKPKTDFEDWIKAYLRFNTYAKAQSSETNMSIFQREYIQPIIVAAVNETPCLVESLLSAGADPNTHTTVAYSKLSNPRNQNSYVPETLLDIIQTKLKHLKNYDGFAKPTPTRPKELLSEIHYVKGLEKDSYAHWSALRDYQVKRAAIDKECKIYREATERRPDEGTEEKMTVVQSMISQLERVEKVLKEKGGKKFYELHPNVEQPAPSNYPMYNSHHPTQQKPYKTSFDWAIPNLNDEMRAGYMKLYEAVWKNDLETIKSMTLRSWGEEGKLTGPLQIAVRDNNGFSPFALALLRGHRDLALKIVEICQLQYHKTEESPHRLRWKMRGGDDDSDMTTADDEAELPITSELVSDTFTVEDLGEVQNIVQSTVLPKMMIEWPCAAHRFDDSHEKQIGGSVITLLQYAVESDNLDLLRFVIQVGAEQARLMADDDEPRSYSIAQHVFKQAVALGRTTILAELISWTGAGIPWNKLIKTSGLELKIKPKYYQGLSVGGRKRADWAQAPGGMVHITEETTPPLLQAAKAGCVESVEWLMSDAPMRHYRTWKEGNERDRRVKTLEDADSGFEGQIGKWLGSGSELTLHCAILHNPHNDSDLPGYLALIKHLVSVNPDFLEQTSAEGLTPLHLSTYVQKPALISYLLASSANQRHRDKSGRNVLHAMIATSSAKARTDAALLSRIITLFDKAAVKAMMLEKCSIYPSSLTPMALWLACNKPGYGFGMWYKSDILEVLMQYADDDFKVLDVGNGEGETPLHVTVKSHLPLLTSYLLSLRPSLLYRESATGRTPLEMSHDAYTAELVAAPPDLSPHLYITGNDYERYSITSKPVSDFRPMTVDEKEAEEWEVQDKRKTWEVCEKVDLDHKGNEGGKRKLVGLGEANEVARRLAAKMGSGDDVIATRAEASESKEEWNMHRAYRNRRVVRRTDVVSDWMGGL